MTMPLLLLSFLRFAARTPWSTAAALLGLSLGVVSTVAVHCIGLAISESLRDRTPPHLRSVTHVAQREGATMADYFALRRQWRRGALPQVAFATPIVQGQLVVEQPQRVRYQVIGGDWYGPGSAAALQRAGGAFTRNGVVVDASTGLAVDEVFALGGESWTVVVVVDAGLRNALFLDYGDALAVLDRPATHLSFVALGLRDPFAGVKEVAERLLPGWSAGLPLEATELAGWQMRPVESLRPEQRFSQAALFNFAVLGLLALLIAWFLIFQACVLWLRRLDALLTRLWVLGCSRAALRGCFLLFVAGLGVLAILVGLAGGYGLASWLVRMSTLGVAALPEITLSAIVVGKAMFSGLAVALAGAGFALLRRRRFGGDAGPELTRPSWPAAALGGALLAIALFFDGLGLLGGLGAVAALGLIALALVAPALRLARHGLRQARPAGYRGLLLRLGVREAAWFERDLGVALGALVLAAGVSIGIGLMVASFAQDFQRMLKQRLSHEFYLSGGNAPAHLGRLARALQANFPAAAVQPYGALSTRLGGQTLQVGYTRFSQAEAARYGYTGALAADEAMANERLLAAIGLQVGDLIRWGGAPLRIVHAFPGFGDAKPRLLLDVAGGEARFGALTYDRISVSGIAGAALENWLARNAPDVEVVARSALRSRALEVFQRSFAITRALTLLALIVAVVGLYNALLALRLNQRAGVRLLRALGLSAGEQRWLSTVRGAALGAIAMALALPLGLGMGWLLCELVNPRAFGWRIELSMAPSGWLPPVLFGFAAALLASLLPAPKEGLGLGPWAQLS